MELSFFDDVDANFLVFGMIHLLALPGTPAADKIPTFAVDQALREADCFARNGVDGILIENMHDVPYQKGSVGPEIVAWMTRIAFEIKRATGLPCGIQILAGANKEALAAAHAAGLDFVRVEGFVFGHVADEGWIEASAAELLRFRKLIGAEHIRIFADIKKKHSAHAVTADVDLVETAKAAEFFRADGLIVTGSSTGESANVQELKEVKSAVKLPVWVGSGVTVDNVADYREADGLIVGSHFKKDGFWANPVDEERVAAFMEKVRELRGE